MASNIFYIIAVCIAFFLGKMKQFAALKHFDRIDSNELLENLFSLKKVFSLNIQSFLCVLQRGSCRESIKRRAQPLTAPLPGLWHHLLPVSRAGRHIMQLWRRLLRHLASPTHVPRLHLPRRRPRWSRDQYLRLHQLRDRSKPNRSGAGHFRKSGSLLDPLWPGCSFGLPLLHSTDGQRAVQFDGSRGVQRCKSAACIAGHRGGKQRRGLGPSWILSTGLGYGICDSVYGECLVQWSHRAG